MRVKRRSCWHGKRGGEIELVQKVGVRRDEVERNRARAGTGLDALREIARPLRIGQAAPGTNDAGVVRRVVGALAGQLQRALDRAPEVFGADKRAGRVVDLGRSWKLYVRPPSVGAGIETARSGTSLSPALPPTRRKPTSPSCVKTAT